MECFPAIQHPMQAHHHRLTWCVTEMTARSTLSGALNGSQNCAEKSCEPVVTPSTCQSICSQYEQSGMLQLVYAMFIPYSWVILNLHHSCRTLCSLCPSILLSWKTPRTSLFKSVGLPTHSFFSPSDLPLETHVQAASKSQLLLWQGQHPSHMEGQQRL